MFGQLTSGKIIARPLKRTGGVSVLVGASEKGWVAPFLSLPFPLDIVTALAYIQQKLQVVHWLPEVLIFVQHSKGREV